MTRTQVFRHGDKIVDRFHSEDGNNVAAVVKSGYVPNREIFTIREGEYLDIHIEGYETDNTDNGNSYTLKLNNEVVESGRLYNNVPNPITVDNGGVKFGMYPGQDLEVHVLNNNE